MDIMFDYMNKHILLPIIVTLLCTLRTFSETCHMLCTYHLKMLIIDIFISCTTIGNITSFIKTPLIHVFICHAATVSHCVNLASCGIIEPSLDYYQNYDMHDILSLHDKRAIVNDCILTCVTIIKLSLKF